MSGITICTDAKSLDSNHSIEYPGVTINKNLTWEDHIDKICSKICGKINLFTGIIPMIAGIAFYNALMFPNFDYCDIVLGETGNSSLRDACKCCKHCAYNFRPISYVLSYTGTEQTKLEAVTEA